MCTGISSGPNTWYQVWEAFTFFLLCIDVQGTLDILTEQTHIKDALSRIIVEIAKREWPQKWPSMIADLNNIYTQGVALQCSSLKALIIVEYLKTK